MSLQISSIFPPIGEAQLCVFEEDVATIPAAYRAFLLENNGGLPEPSGFVFMEPDGSPVEMAIAEFLGIGAGIGDSLEFNLEVYEGRIPGDLFPIASTPGGDLVLLAHDHSPRAGKVVYWTHDEEADEGEDVDERNIYPIADSFEAFLASLHD